MIPQLPDYYIAGSIYTAFCFCIGVSWSAYRAVGWVDRMRAWAGSVVDSVAGADAGGRGPEGVPPGDGAALMSPRFDYFDLAFHGHDGRGTE